MRKNVVISRPLAATLHVHLENGETFPAKDEHLAEFGLVDSSALSTLMYRQFTELLDNHDLYDDEHYDYDWSEIYPLYNLFTIALHSPDAFTKGEVNRVILQVVNMERRLRGLEPLPLPEEA